MSVWSIGESRQRIERSWSFYTRIANSVPEIARQYQVSRQHIQVTVNRLLEKKLVASRPNPRHKRSSLLALTASGRSLFVTVLADEERALQALFAGIPKADVRTSRSTLEQVLAALAQLILPELSITAPRPLAGKHADMS